MGLSCFIWLTRRTMISGISNGPINVKFILHSHSLVI
jgi:hypothetical protein